jgi:tetratricopeptide (TPR) repeat protein
MNREQGAFLLGGLVFGLVAGLLLGFVFFKPGVFGTPPGHPPMSASAPSRGTAGPATGDMDPGGAGSMGNIMDEIAQLKEQVARDPKDFTALTRLGDIYLGVSKFDEARGFFEQAVAANPHDSEALTSLGICYLQLDQPERALELCREASRHSPDFWPAALYTVVASLELGDAGAAEEGLGKLKALNPSFEHLADLEASVARMSEGHTSSGG